MKFDLEFTFEANKNGRKSDLFDFGIWKYNKPFPRCKID